MSGVFLPACIRVTASVPSALDGQERASISWKCSYRQMQAAVWMLGNEPTSMCNFQKECREYRHLSHPRKARGLDANVK